MAKFLLGLATGLVLVFLTLILLFFAALRFRERPPDVADNSVLVLRLEGDLPEKPPLELPLGLSGSAVTVANVWMALKKAAADPRIRAVALEPEGLSAGWAKVEEIRSDIEQFRKSGKPVFAYLRTPRAKEYYLALAADRIFMGASDQLYLYGMRAEIMYFKKTLDKLGVTVEVEHAGKYKDFGDMFTRTDMSPETRESIGSVVDELYGNLVARIAASRKKTPEEVRATIDQGPFTATRARAAGLVDELRFEDEMWGALRDRLKAGEPNKMPLARYVKVPPDAAGIGGRSRIALVVAEGDIVRGGVDDDGAGETNVTSYGFNKLLRQVAADSSIKGVIVRIDSPGGEVTASDEIWRQMNLLGKKKPLVISMSDLAASGGYFMAMTGDPVVAYPETQTGSIGVVFGKPELRGLYDKLGITKDSVERGKNAAITSDYKPLTPEQRLLLKQGIDESYRDFVGKVAQARRRSFGEVEPVAQGRVWLGSQAQARGLVDRLGGLDTAVDLLKQRAGIPAGEHVTVLAYPARRGVLDFLLKKRQDDEMEARLRPIVGRMPVRAWMAGGFLRLTPYWLEVR
jgi:protease-4